MVPNSKNTNFDPENDEKMQNEEKFGEEWKMPDYIQKMLKNSNIENDEKNLTHDDLLFHPCEDELNSNWLK